MVFIVGGAYQGKLLYAKERFEICDEKIADGKTVGFDNIENIKLVCNYHILIKRLMDNNKDPMEFTKTLIRNNPDIIIIMNEIGCGIVPLSEDERRYRENAGRIGCFIAKNSSETIRLVCGCAQKIKG